MSVRIARASAAAGALAGALLLASPPSAAETFMTCTGVISSLPAVIDTQGIWCLTHDLGTAITTGEAITIDTNNVTIDCNGFKIGGLAAGVGTQAHGIEALDRANATIRNCNIRGFYRGVFLKGGTGHLVEDNRFDANTLSAVLVDGDGIVVQRNRIFDTGPSTVSAMAIAVYAIGGVDVVDNTISGVVAATGGNGDARGVFLFSNQDGRIADNRIRGLVSDGTGDMYGVLTTLASYITVRGNDLVGDGSATSVGISCAGSNAVTRDNAISFFGTGNYACNDHGGNVVKP